MRTWSESAAAASPARRHIYLATPWAPMGGGMYKVADYLMQSQADAGRAPPGSAEAVELRPLESRGGGNAVWSMFVVIAALWRIARDALAGRLAGVHVNVAERLSLVRKGMIVALCRLLGVPTVLHLHAAQLPQNYAGMLLPSRWLTRRLFRLSPSVVVLGESARRFVVDTLGVPAQRVTVVANGVPGPVRPPAALREGREQPGGIRLLFVGNLSERKGVTDLIDAVDGIHAVRPDLLAGLRLIGGGEIDRYRELVSARQLGGVVEFLGWQGQAEIAAAMTDADVLVLPSYDEGLPLVILEALAHALPVICTPVGEIPRNLVGGRDAVFVEPGDLRALTTAIVKLAGEPALREQLGRQGRRLYEERFGLERFFDRIAEVHRATFGVAAQRKGSQGG